MVQKVAKYNELRNVRLHKKEVMGPKTDYFADLLSGSSSPLLPSFALEVDLRSGEQFAAPLFLKERAINRTTDREKDQGKRGERIVICRGIVVT